MGARAVYVFNPDCGCVVCQHNGHPPAGPDAGHSYAYDAPHVPPHRFRSRVAGDGPYGASQGMPWARAAQGARAVGRGVSDP